MQTLPEPSTWDDLYRTYRQEFSNPGPTSEKLWVFRGQRVAAWKLETSLERALRRWPDVGEPVPTGFKEEGLVREFQRRLHSLDPGIKVPDLDDIIGWLALMQHYGAPTRLQDWTYSFFVALYFAVENADDDAAVFAIEAHKCNEVARDSLQDDKGHVAASLVNDPFLEKSETFRCLFGRKDPLPLIYRVNAYHLNPRIIAQQGLFLCPGDVNRSFEENATGVSRSKLVVPKRLHQSILRELSYMNIGRNSLFPGIDGLAGSLHALLAYPDRLLPNWRRKRKTRPFENWRPFEPDAGEQS